MHTGRRSHHTTRVAAFALAAAVGLACTVHTTHANDDRINLVEEGMFTNPNTLYLQAGNVDLSQPKQGFAQFAARANPVKAHVIHLDGPITPERRERLEAAGLVIGDYLATNAFIVTFGAVNRAAAAELGFVRWFGEFENEWKVSPELGARQYATPERQALAAQGKAAAVVNLFGHADSQAAYNAIKAIPGVVITGRDQIGSNPVVMIEIPMENVGALAQMDAVQFVEDVPEVTLRNSEARWVVQSNIPGVNTLHDKGLRGQGQVVGVLDSKLASTHCAFVDAVNPIGPSHRKILAYNTSLGASSHGSHVSGTAAGDDGGTGNLRGVAYQAKIVYNDIPAFNETAVNNSLQTHHNQGGRIHTNSWGNDGTTAYDSLARGFDVFGRNNEDSLSTLAVTNQSLLKNPENAKNLLACGATSRAPSQHNHCTGGTGPTADGRRKPEVYAPGCNTVSASTSGCGTSTSSGTSMATPAIAGTGLLIRQYFLEGFYPGGSANPSDAFTPTGALLKAALVNSAVDMAPAGYPSNQEGWGRILADNVLFFTGDTRKLVVEDVRHASGLTTGATAEYSYNVNSSSQALRITMVFMDAPGASGSSMPVVNNLNLEVISPGGDVYRGNVFSGGFSATGGSFDAINNVEQVHIASPSPGSWTVRVIGANVPVGPQGFALVVTGDVQSGPASLSIITANLPGLTLPNTPTTFDVTINPGDDTLVPGSPMLHYRDAARGFTSVALTPVGGNDYEASLPGWSCDSEPEFYVSAEGVTTGLRTAPPNAPTNVYTVALGELESIDVFDQSFESGTLPLGWSASGLWNVTASCGTGGCDGSFFAYYGQTGTCNYDTGATNSGSLLSPMITLPTVPPGGSITLSYCSRRETESGTTWDLTHVRIGGASIDQPTGNNLAWQTRNVDLTSRSGETIQLEFFFNTVDGVQNSFLGWQVDNIQIVAVAAVCEDVDCPGDTNGDGVVDFADFSTVLNEYGQTGKGLAGDLNGDGVVNFDDFSEVLGNYGNDCN